MEAKKVNFKSLRKIRGLIIFLISAIISLGIGILSILCSFAIIIKIYPSTGVLDNGNTVHFMPMAQLFVSMIIGLLIFIFLIIFLYHFLNKRILKNYDDNGS